MNATDAQVLNMNRSTPPPATSSTAQSSSTVDNQTGGAPSGDLQNQMIHKFSEQSRMTVEYSKLLVHTPFSSSISSVFDCSCLAQNGWNYDKAAQNFQDLVKTVRLLSSSVRMMSNLFPFRMQFHLKPSRKCKMATQNRL